MWVLLNDCIIEQFLEVGPASAKLGYTLNPQESHCFNTVDLIEGVYVYATEVYCYISYVRFLGDEPFSL